MSTDVTVVGAGPVGLVLAILLGRRGRRVEVLERHPRPYGLPRAVHLDHEAARILQAAGVMDDLAPLTEPMDAYEWRDRAGRTLLRAVAESPCGPSGWPTSSMFSQPDLERLLESAAAGLGTVQVRRGRRAAAIAQDRAAVEVRTTDAEGGDPEATASRWVVGCDGAGSFVRAAVAAPVAELGYFHRWLVVDVVPAGAPRWEPLNLQLCDPARPTTAVSGGPGRRRFEFMHLPGEDPEGLERPGAAWRLLEPWGVTPANASVERQANYTFQARMVEQWRRGRVLLAGDAAHQMPPFAGQGLCAGLRDAANLAWKLDLVIAGLAPAALLDTYGSERAPQVRADIELSVALGQVVCVLDEAEAAVRDEAMVAEAARTGPIEIPPGPPLGPGITLRGDPHAGALGRQAVVSGAGREGRGDDLFGAGWRLVAGAGVPPPDGDAGAWWAAAGGRTVILEPPGGGSGRDGAVVDVTGGYLDWLEAMGAVAVLQRPDFHVFGTAGSAGAVAGLLAAARAAVTAPG